VGNGEEGKGKVGSGKRNSLAANQWNAISYNRHIHMASAATPGFVVTVDYIHGFTSGRVLLSCILGVGPY